MNLDVSNIVYESFQEFPPYISMVVFVGKCNLDCYRCPNKRLPTTTLSLGEILALVSPLVDGFVVLGGEPTMYPQEVSELLRRARDKGLKTKVFTNGCKPEVLGQWLSEGLLDAVSVDLKSLTCFQEISGTNIKNEDYLTRFGDCLALLSMSPNVRFEVRTTGLVKDGHCITDIGAVMDYMSKHYPGVTHIIQDDAFEFTP